MKRWLLSLLFVCSSIQAAGIVDLKFGRYQIADSQWNVASCTQTATCQIYSKNPGVAYKIPWTNGQLSWATGDYVAFVKTGNAVNPYNAVQYNSAGQQKAVMGTGHIINMGNDFFFFVGNDNNTGQLFSMTTGMNSTAGVIWTGTLNPTVAQADTYAASYGSTTPLAAGQTATPAAPTLCCGASATQFNANSTNVAKLHAFVSRVTNDSQVYVEQIGNQNVVKVTQTGTPNNSVHYVSTGMSNATVITQSGTASTVANQVDLAVAGNYNTSTITQTSTGGTKGVFVAMADNNNSLTVQQRDSGSHYAEISLSGGNKNVDVLQQGSAGHMARISLSGLPTDLSLSQSGSTQNFYSIQFNCATTGGCPKITVTQGQ